MVGDGWNSCADCAQHVCDRVDDTTAEQKRRRKRSIFDAAPRGPLKAEMPERCGMPLAQMCTPKQTWRQAVPGSSPHGPARESIPRDAAWGHQLYQPSVPISWCAAEAVSRESW